jgi:tRNA nucleotidyltransferase (CCA-adding enzyme)
LRRYKLPTLIIIACRSHSEIRRLIWLNITKWTKIQAPIDGNDLKKMGYKPSPQFKEILARLLCATLDGEIKDRMAAEEFVRVNYLIK